MTLNFPDGDTTPLFKAQNGLTYYWIGKAWVTIAPEYEFPDPDDYVLRAGDTMSGTLRSVRFIANYDLEDLQELS